MVCTSEMVGTWRYNRTEKWSKENDRELAKELEEELKRLKYENNEDDKGENQK